MNSRLLVLSLLLFTSSVVANDTFYPGRLIDIGTHRLHINCIGSGSPTVIMDSGIGGFSLEWSKIQARLSGNVRVCSYDRAGYGWSDPGPRPRTTARISGELHRLLKIADIPAPYILVGHSFGGYNVRFFASKYPRLIAGLVLIDASHPEQFNTEEYKRNQQTVKKKKPKYKNSHRIRVVKSFISENYPEENKWLAHRLMSTNKSKNTLLDELDNMERSANQVIIQTDHPPYSFPVTIITRGKRVWSEDEPGERRELEWIRLQNDLQYISMNSSHFLARRSGHIVHLDQPDFVSNKILATVYAIRATN